MSRAAHHPPADAESRGTANQIIGEGGRVTVAVVAIVVVVSSGAAGRRITALLFYESSAKPVSAVI